MNKQTIDTSGSVHSPSKTSQPLAAPATATLSLANIVKMKSHPGTQGQLTQNAARVKQGQSQLLLDDQKSIENVEATPTYNDKSMEDLEMMLQMQENQAAQDSSNVTPGQQSRVQLQAQPNSYTSSMETGSPHKGVKKGSQMPKSRVVPQSQQKMTKNSSKNMQPAKMDKQQQQNYMNLMQASTMQPKRPSSMHRVTSPQKLGSSMNPTGNPQFYQTVGSQQNTKNTNSMQKGNQTVQNAQIANVGPKTSQMPPEEQTSHPTGVIESHTMQVNRLQDHKNKRVVAPSQNNTGTNNQPGKGDSNVNANTASIVSQIMMNQQIQQNINFQQSNNMKQQMKNKLNIKVLKASAEPGPRSEASRLPPQAHPIPPSNQSIQSTKVTNPSVLASDMPVQVQQQHSANSGGDPGRQKSPTYTQTLTSYNSNSAKPQKSNTKKNIRILSNSASLKKTLQSNASNPSIMSSHFQPGSQSEVQSFNIKKSQTFSKKNATQKSETRYQTVLAMDAMNQLERNRANQLQAVSGGIDQENAGRNSDYYRTTQNQKFATQAVNFKAFNSVSPHRNKGNKTSGSVQNKNPQHLLSQQKSAANLDHNLGLKNSIKNLHKNNENKGYNMHLMNSASRAARDNSKDSIRKKPYATVSNKGKSMNKFGQGKNSVKPPTKKQAVAGQQSQQRLQQPYTNQGSNSNQGSRNNSPQRMKMSRSSMGVGHQQMPNMQASVMSHSSGSQLSNTSGSARLAKDSFGPQQASVQRGGSQMNNVYTQLSDRVRKKQSANVGSYQVQSTSGNTIKPLQRNSSMSQYAKKNQPLHYLPIQAKRGSMAPQTQQDNLARPMTGNSSANGSRGGGQPFSNASGRTSDNKFASQERAMKLAEDGLNKIDEILAQNQKHLQQKKKASTLQQEDIQAMAAGVQGPVKIQLSEKGPHQLLKSGSIVNDRQSPLGYLTQLNQNTMINLNNNNIVSNNDSTTPQKGRPRVKRNSGEKINNSNSRTGGGAMLLPGTNDKISFTDDIQQFAVMQKINTQSPIDIPSSSNTSKHSNKTFSQSLVSNTNQYAPEVKKIGQQFNEIVKGLQIIEQSKLEQQDEARQLDENDPLISDVISKLYSVKSSYDQLIKTMSKQITQLQTQIQKPQQYQNVPVMLQPERMSGKRVGVAVSTNNINVSGSQYNKVSYRKEMTPHGTGIRDPPLSASSQSRTRMDAFVGGTGGSMNKCKYCKGMGQAPSSNSASERHTYAVASDRAVHTVENVPMNSIENLSNQNSQNRMISVQRFGNAADHITINLPMPQEQSIASRESQRTKYEEMLEKKFNSEKKGRTHSQSVQANTANEQRNNVSNTALLQQIRTLKDENKKMDALQEQNKKFIKDLQEKDKVIFKSERQLAQSQSLVQKKAQELKDNQKKIKELEASLAQLKKQKQELALKNQQKMNDRNNSKNKKTQHVQTDIYLDNFISEKELDLLVDLKKQERKMKKLQKEKTYNANKISKFIYFFFTLQNKGIPVNEIYENDGVKFIQTDRFEEIMGQSNGNKDDAAGGSAAKDGQDKNKGGEDNTDQLSFYSDDSYEYVQFNPDIFERSKFKNIKNVQIPPLDFHDLPEYETTDEEEDEEGDEENSYAEGNNQLEKTENEVNTRDNSHDEQLMSPAPHDRLNQYINPSTGLKDNQPNDDAIHITNNDLGLDSIKNFNPHGGGHPNTSSKKQHLMNKKSNQQNMNYSENFYQQSGSQHGPDGSSTNQKQKRQNDSGMLFDDAPKSVTEESSMIGDEKNLASELANKMQPPGTTTIPNKLFRHEMSQGKRDPAFIQKMNPLMDNSIQHNFDQSEKFDESAGQINPDAMGSRLHRIGQGIAGGGGGGGLSAGHQEAMEIMGVTIDSQSFDQSIIDQSMTSELKGKRKYRKKKEDLDGSRLFREHGDDDVNDQSMISQGGNGQRSQHQKSQMKQSIASKHGQQSDSNQSKGAANKRN